MGSETKIGWAHHTFNAWRGCEEISPGCDNCYAATFSKRNPRLLGIWGPKGKRVVAAESYWQKPFKWNRDAMAAGQRRRVFCQSMSDVFENWSGPLTSVAGDELRVAVDTSGHQQFLKIDDAKKIDIWHRRANLNHIRGRLFYVIDSTPWLDWLVLTKRPGNIPGMIPVRMNEMGLLAETYQCRNNLWLGTTCENQQQANLRLPELRKCRGLASVLFVSYEPLLEQVRVDDHFYDWAIFGGETGPGHREMSLYALESGVHSCLRAAKPAVFVKQDSGPYPERQGRISDELWQRKEFPGSVVG